MWKLMMVILLVTVAGCNLIAPIGPIIQLGIMWIEGEAHKYYNTDQETIHRATLAALKELDLVINKEEEKDGTIYINAGDADRFKIKIYAVREKTTKLSIRVNIMGDQPYAEMVYRHVDDQKDVEQFVTLKELNTALEDRARPRWKKHTN